MATCQAVRNEKKGGRRYSKTERLLLGRRQQLIAQLEVQERLSDRVRRESGDELDALAALSETELALSVAEIRSTEVAGIEDALRKIVDGTYGRCEVCGVPIPAARLKAAPWATLCLGCQKQSEAVSHDEGAAQAWDKVDTGAMDDATAGRFIRAYVENGG